MNTATTETDSDALLVQCLKSSGEMVHNIVFRNINNMHWHSGNDMSVVYTPRRYMRDRETYVLEESPSYAYLQKLIQYLKGFCIDYAMSRNQTVDLYNDDTWLLVHYSPMSNESIYKLISYRSTLRGENDQFEKTMVFIIENESFFHAVVMASSNNRKILEDMLNDMAKLCLTTRRPDEKQIDDKMSQTAALMPTNRQLKVFEILIL